MTIVYNMIDKFEECDVSVGLEAFDLFEQRHDASISSQYPSLIIQNLNVSPAEFNPNVNYLHFNYENTFITSPFHFLELLEDESKTELPVLQQSIRFLHFLNWACYLYPTLNAEYESITKFPSKLMRDNAELISSELAKITFQLTPDSE